MPISPTLFLAPKFVLSVGGAYIRLWHRDRGLILEVPPCVVVDRQTGELKLYGQEAADLEGKVPPHLEFWRVWVGDTLIDRQLLRSLLTHVLESQLQSERERWERAFRTVIVLPETVSPLHRRWLLHTAREAGWWWLRTVSLGESFLSSGKQNTAEIQGVLDLGFSSARLILYIGEEILLTVAEPQLSLQNVAEQFARYLLFKRKQETIPQVFYDQHWLKSRFMYDLTKDEPKEYTPTADDWQTLQREYQQNVQRFLQASLGQLTDSQRADIRRSTISLIGGASNLLENIDDERFAIRLKRSSDTTYASLRQVSRKQ